MAPLSKSVGLSRGSDKRERILRAAVEVFARAGYFNSRVSEIAKEAGVADGTIYLYFQRKEDLLITIFREHIGDYLARLREVVSEEQSAEAKLRRLILFHFEFLGSDRPLAIVFQVELRQSLKFMGVLLEHGLPEYLSLIKEILEQGQQREEFRRELPPQLIANSVFGVLDELVTRWILTDKPYDLIGSADDVASFVIRGVASGTVSPPAPAEAH